MALAGLYDDTPQPLSLSLGSAAFLLIIPFVKRALDIIFGIILLVCGLYALQWGYGWWQAHRDFASDTSYSPTMFLLLFVGALLVASGFCLTFIPRSAGIIGAVALVVTAIIGFCQIPGWWQVPPGSSLVPPCSTARQTKFTESVRP